MKSASAQTPTDSLDYYFDDKGISNGNFIKTDLKSIIQGDWSVIYEFNKKNQLAYEVGIGLIMPYYVHDFLPSIFSDYKGIDNNHFGYSTRLHLKLYINSSETEYWGIQHYRRAFHVINVNDFTFTHGIQKLVGKRMVAEIALGLGIRTQNPKGDQYMFDPDFSFRPILPLMIRFGYVPK